MDFVSDSQYDEQDMSFGKEQKVQYTFHNINLQAADQTPKTNDFSQELYNQNQSSGRSRTAMQE